MNGALDSKVPRSCKKETARVGGSHRDDKDQLHELPAAGLDLCQGVPQGSHKHERLEMEEHSTASVTLQTVPTGEALCWLCAYRRRRTAKQSAATTQQTWEWMRVRNAGRYRSPYII